MYIPKFATEKGFNTKNIPNTVYTRKITIFLVFLAKND